MIERKKIGDKVRFEIFKRDQFTCQYCGNTPPAIVLHIDHIEPVSKGGTNDPDNLITACQNCNSGKSNIPLNQIPQSLQDRAEEVKERELQIKGYYEVMEARRQRIEDEAWQIAEMLERGASEKGMRKDRFASIERFLQRLPYHEVLDAAYIAVSKKHGNRQRFLYFCGICWNKIKEIEEL